MTHTMHKSIAFYIVPHYDDWQLFCGHQVFLDLHNVDTKVVFIYTTADDAGQNDTWWQTGENGAMASLQQVPPFSKLSTTVVAFNGHLITQHRSKKTVSYCLRLPDGFPDGSGSSVYCFQSLKKLQDGHITLSAIDQSTHYASWQDFCDTLEEIITVESQGIPQESCWVNSIEPDTTLNPNDHADHMATASAVQSIVAGKYNHRWWLTYYSYYCKPNLFDLDLKNKSALFTAYLNATESHPYAKRIAKMRTDEWVCWGDKNYYRSICIDPNYQPGYMPLAHFDLKNLEQKALRFKRCVRVDEEHTAGGVRVTNLVTQQTVLLNSASKIIWEMLRQPYSINDLFAMFRLAWPSDSSSRIEIALHALLAALLSQNLIAVDEAAIA